MSQKLKQAIAATRAGQTKDAQILLTQVLQENPDNTQAWYLLSLLVDSPTKKQAYLNKVIALEPTHEKAQQALAQLQQKVETVVEETAVPTPIPVMPTADEEPFFDTDEDEESIPDWLAEIQPAAPETATFSEADPSSPEEIPDWLKGTMENGWVESEQPTLVSERVPEGTTEAALAASALEEFEDALSFDNESLLAAVSEESEVVSADAKPATKTSPSIPSKKQSSTAVWDRLLWILIAGAIIILLLMIYMLFS